MSKEEELFRRIDALKKDVQSISSIVQNPIEGIIPLRELDEWSDEVSDLVIKLLDIKHDVLEFLT